MAATTAYALVAVVAQVRAASAVTAATGKGLGCAPERRRSQTRAEGGLRAKVLHLSRVRLTAVSQQAF